MPIMGQAIKAIMTIFPNYGHKGHYGQINMAINEACLNWPINLEDKCRSAPKTIFKKLDWLKSYGQNNVRIAKMAISFVFLARQCTQSDYPGAALPSGVQSSSLYFWNQQCQENGGSFSANSKSNFWFFCPPLMCMFKLSLGCISA